MYLIRSWVEELLNAHQVFPYKGKTVIYSLNQGRQKMCWARTESNPGDSLMTQYGTMFQEVELGYMLKWGEKQRSEVENGEIY